MHLVIHLWTPLNRKRKQKPKQGTEELQRSSFFLLFHPKKQVRFILQAQVCLLKSHRTQWVIRSVVQVEFEGGCSRKKRPRPGNSRSRREDGLLETYSRQAVLAVWTGPLSTPSPSQQYNSPVARGSSLHCVSSPGPPQLKWSQAARKMYTKMRGEGEREEGALTKSRRNTLFL